MAKLSVVSRSDAERLLLQGTIKKGTSSARTITRARILLKADRGAEKPEWTDTKIAEAVEVGRPTVERLRKRAALEGVEAAFHDRPKRKAAVWGLVCCRTGTENGHFRPPAP